MHEEFIRELKDSLYVHRPLPLHTERSLEAQFKDKKVVAEQNIYTANVAVATPYAGAKGRVETKDGIISITAALRSEAWPKGAAADGDYSNFGTARVCMDFAASDWQGYNRLKLSVMPQLVGARVAHLNVSIVNDGKIKLPDAYFREGATVFDLKNGEWNECIWEFDAMPRDAICSLNFYVFLSGQDVGAGDTLRYLYKDVVLQKIQAPEHEHGWQRKDDAIMLSTVGYWPQGAKTAVCGKDEKFFELVDAFTKKTVYQAAVNNVQNERGAFGIIDFSEYSLKGRYFLRIGEKLSTEFDIDDKLCTESLWRVVNFLFCERCGTSVPGKHGTCHLDITAEHKGVKMSYAGGWHDAGDVSQQTAQTGEVTHALFENAMACKQDRPLYLRLMEEAQWGLDFILRTRFKDGYRASSAGATRFTDNLEGNFDDIKARVHNHSYENFLLAGVEAYAASCLRGYDDSLADSSLLSAKEDFAFAAEKFAQTGVEPAHMFEHTFGSSLSQYYAVIVQSASYLYEAAGDEEYAETARKYARLMMACQEQGEAGIELKGFFYRDEKRKVIVHYNHQSREAQYMQAMAQLCRTQAASAEIADWEQCMRLYGEYLKAIAKNTAPYGMLPAGIHKMDEIDDTMTFKYLHAVCEHGEEKANYKAQLESGKHLSKDYVLRNFPVWFSFRGNTAVMLSMGKAASVIGRYFEDEELLQIGREQLYWMWGKNPFGQSLIYGAGSNYCRQYAVLCGECVGEVPVGVETLDNEDLPYWPQNNNATFREVWTSAASRWLWVCADYV